MTAMQRRSHYTSVNTRDSRLAQLHQTAIAHSLPAENGLIRTFIENLCLYHRSTPTFDSSVSPQASLIKSNMVWIDVPNRDPAIAAEIQRIVNVMTQTFGIQNRVNIYPGAEFQHSGHFAISFYDIRYNLPNNRLKTPNRSAGPMTTEAPRLMKFGLFTSSCKINGDRCKRKDVKLAIFNQDGNEIIQGLELDKRYVMGTGGLSYLVSVVALLMEIDPFSFRSLSKADTINTSTRISTASSEKEPPPLIFLNQTYVFEIGPCHLNKSLYFKTPDYGFHPPVSMKASAVKFIRELMRTHTPLVRRFKKIKAIT